MKTKKSQNVKEMPNPLISHYTRTAGGQVCSRALVVSCVSVYKGFLADTTILSSHL